VLYHGTTVRRAEHILKDGLEPRLGEFFRSVYPRARVRPFISAADEPYLRKVFSAIRHAVGQEVGSDKWRVTWEEFRAHAAVLVIETDRPKFRQATAMDRPQRGIEKYDYYAFERVQADRLIRGEEALELLRGYTGLLKGERPVPLSGEQAPCVESGAGMLLRGPAPPEPQATPRRRAR
jgi:hypothetical protein